MMPLIIEKKKNPKKKSYFWEGILQLGYRLLYVLKYFFDIVFAR